jgi:hypothetical protein
MFDIAAKGVTLSDNVKSLIRGGNRSTAQAGSCDLHRSAEQEDA